MSAADRPPRGLAWLAARIVPALADEAALGDLDERYRDRARTASRAAATRWYVRQLLGFLARPLLAHPSAWARRLRDAFGALRRDLGTDVRLAVRSLIREGRSTAVTVATLAAGIGASTAVYAVFNHTLFRPVPGIGDVSRLVSVYVRPDPTTPSYTTATHAHLIAMRDMPAFAGLAGYRTSALPVRLDRGDPHMLQVTSVSLGYFDILGVQAAAGRLFAADEYERSDAAIAIISERLWRSALGADAAAIGAAIHVTGKPVTVVGVAKSFRGLARVGDEDVWLPVGADAALGLYRGGEYRWDRMVGRLRPAVTVAVAREQATSAFERVGRVGSGAQTFTAAVYAGITDGFGEAEQSMTELFWLAISGAGLLLLLACANVAGMLIARNLRRQRDLALRTAIGASRLRILRELLVEASLVSAAAAVGGGALAMVLLEGFRGDRLVPYMPALEELTVDWRVCAFAAVMATTTVVLAGGLPAALAARTGPRARLQDALRRTSAGRVRRSLTTLQVALSLALVASAGVLAESVARLRSVELGFDPDRLFTVTLQPRLAGRDDLDAFFTAIERQLSSAAGIEAVGIAASPPLGSMQRTLLGLSDEAPTEPGTLRYVSGDYFRALRIPIVGGRAFTAADAASSSASGPIIVDELVVQQLFGATPAPGRTIHVQRRGAVERRRVIGVVGTTAWTLDAPRRPTVYLPVGDLRVATFHVRSGLPPRESEQTIRRVVRQVEPLLPVDVRTMAADIDWLTAEPRVQARLASVLAVLALGLALVGVYSAASSGAEARRREFGIRMALGASRSAIARDVVGGAGWTGALGVGGGVALYVWVSRYLESRLHGLSALDPSTMAGACGLLLIVAVAGAWLPARRATRVDPTSALRAE